VMRQWATRISHGGELTLEIEGMTIAEALKLKKKIQAIKIYRERYHVGLKEAKDAVEALAAEHGIAAQGAGCAGVFLLGVALGKSWTTRRAVILVSFGHGSRPW